MLTFINIEFIRIFMLLNMFGEKKIENFG